jgi:peptide/nickel transport system permease protein
MTTARALETVPSAEPTARRRPPSLFWRLLRNQSALIGLIIVASMLLVAIFATPLAPYGYDEDDLASLRLPPAWESKGTAAHLLGTDSLGRDILSRIMYAARMSLSIAGTGVIIAAVLGIMLGLVAGYYRGWIDAVIMRTADAQLSFPYLLLAIAVMALLRPNLGNLVLVLVLRSWVVYARVVRASTMTLKQREFVQAAQALGAGGPRVIFRHIAPNVITSAIVVSSFQLAELIILESSLSFLGLGVQPPAPSWGSMLSDGREYMATAWWLATFPGLAIIVTVLGINLLGDALRDILDPRLRNT